MPATSKPARNHGDEADLYRRHHRDLLRAVACAVHAPRELIEDACQSAWAIMLRCQPERGSLFAWLRVVAIHEAYRLWRAQRREALLEDLDGHWRSASNAVGVTIEDAVEARLALRLLAELPERQRDDLALLIAGFSYREIGELTGGRTYTNVNKHLAKARMRMRRLQTHSEGATLGRESS